MSRGPRRGPADADHHLAWFFNDAWGAVSGLRSSWAMVDGPGKVGVPGSATLPAHRLSAARRESDVASRLERLSVDDRVVLSLAHSRACPWPLQCLEDKQGRDYRSTLWAGAVRRYGQQVAPLLPTTMPAREAFMALVVKAQDVPDDRELVFDVREVDGRDAAWRRGDDPRSRLRSLLSRGFADWLYSPAREDDHPAAVREACADARLALRRALDAWATVAPQPDAEGRVRQRGRRRGASLVELVRPSGEPLELFAPAWEAEPIAAE